MTFFKNVITKSLFLFTLGGFIALSAMDYRIKHQTSEEITASVQSVFGHRLRLKNNTYNQLLVCVEKSDESHWRAIVEMQNSIDLGSMHDDFVKITVKTYQTGEILNSEIEIPVNQIKQFLSIPETQMLYYIINGKGNILKNEGIATSNCYFESNPCKKNAFPPFINLTSDGIGLHPARRAFPAFANEITNMLMHSMTMGSFQQSDPFKFYQCVLGIDDVFTPEDIQIRADRLAQEWNPDFYTQDEESEQIKMVQEYIKSAKRFFIEKLQGKTQKAYSAAAPSTQQQYAQPEYTQPEYSQIDEVQDEASTSQAAYSRFPNIQESSQSKDVSAYYFNLLLNRVKYKMFSYKEQRTCSSEYNITLLEKFEHDEPVIPFEELSELINKCIQNYDAQTKIKVDDYTSYIQKQLINPGSNINVTGDIHGSIHSLTRILDDALSKIKTDTNFVFLGDYTDRGLFGAEVLALLICLKLSDWDNVFLIRGNHEDYSMNMHGGWGLDDQSGIFIGAFKTELEAKYKSKNARTLLLQFGELYKRLPLALYLGTNKNTWVQFCHGGFQPDFNPNEFLSNSESIREIRFANGFSSCLNGFMWGDFYLKDAQIIQDGKARGNLLGFIRNIPNIMSPQNPECTNVKAIFRGHQHSGCGLKMFPWKIDESMRKYENAAGLGLEPMPWGEVVEKDQDGLISDHIENQDGAVFDIWKIRICYYTPIFTFSTATEHGISDETFYGILQTKENFTDWMLEPILLN